MGVLRRYELMPRLRSVVVGACARRCGQGGEGLAVEGVAEPVVVHVAGQDGHFLTGPAGDRAGGRVVLEGFGAGTPVVTTSPESIPYFVEHERTGLLSAVGDSKALAANVIRLLRDPDLAALFYAHSGAVAFTDPLLAPASVR